MSNDVTSLPDYPWVPDTIRTDRLENYLSIGCLMLMLYDHFLTLDREIEWIWTLEWRLLKLLFLFNRYCIFVLLTFEPIIFCLFPVSMHICAFVMQLTLWLPVATFTMAQLMILVRVRALYGHGKIITRCLIAVFGLGFIAAVTIACIGERTSSMGPSFLPGCGSDFPISWSSWLPYTTVEFLFIILTLFKLRSELNHTVNVLARDSIIYFILVFACLVWRLLSYKFVIDIDLFIPTQSIASIAVGRMMMNIRGLVFDDPDHTIYQQTRGTIQFAVVDTSSHVE